MDKKSIIIIVILAVLVIFYWPIMTKLGFVDPVEETPPAEQVLDSGAVATDQSAATPVVTPQPTDYQQAQPTAQITEQQPDTIVVDTLTVQTGKYQVLMSSLGGGPVSIQLKDHTYRDGRPVEMLPNLERATPEARFGGGTYTTSREHFTCNLQPGEYDATRQDVEVVYTHLSPSGGKIERKYIFHPDRHSFEFSLNIDDPSRFGDRKYELVWNTALEPTEPNRADDWTSMQAAAMMAGSRETLDDFDDGLLRQSLSGSTTWAGVRSKYFAAALIPRNRVAEGVFAEGTENDKVTADGMIEERRITAGLDMPFAAVSPIADSFTVFVGPLDYMMMQEYDVDLEDMLDIGTTPYVGWIIKPFAVGIMWLLPKLYGAIPNYGIVIILFALMVKIVTLPLSMKSFKSMQAMKELQPRVEEMKTRYKKDPQKLNQEMMKMYKTHGVSPLSGCLPIIPQMPLFFALFSVFRSTILLRDAPFFWFINDLSRGAQGIADPYIILVLLMVAAQFVSQKFTMPSTGQNKMLMYMMPLFMGFIFYSFAAGLVLYWTAFSILAMLDYVLFKREKNPAVKKA